jgi:hypothetical protein
MMEAPKKRRSSNSLKGNREKRINERLGKDDRGILPMLQHIFQPQFNHVKRRVK